MKKTGAIFAIQGSPESVKRVLDVAKGFKALVVFDHFASPSEIEKVQSLNKSVILSIRDIPIRTNLVQVAAIVGATLPPAGCHYINTAENIPAKLIAIAEAENIDLGDYKANLPSLIETQSCVMCDQRDGKLATPQDILLDTENFIVFPGSGAFAEGYLMIVPKKHVCSVAELPYKQQEELMNVIELTKTALKNCFGDPVLTWENGSGTGGHGKASNSIVHAHVHVHPTHLDIPMTSEQLNVPLNQIDFSEIGQYKERPYLYILTDAGESYINYDAGRYIPRQFIRQILAEERGIASPLWNWRLYPFWDQVKETGKIVKAELEKLCK